MDLNFRKFPATLIRVKLGTALWTTFVACSQTLTGLFLIGSVLAVVGVATYSTKPDRVAGILESSDSEEEVAGSQAEPSKSKLVRLLVPGPIVKLSESESRSLLVRRYEEARALLEKRGCEDLWYALIYRGISQNGRVEELSYFRRPAQDPLNFREFQFVVDTITKQREAVSEENGDEVVVSVIPEELEHADPLAVMTEALNSSPTLNRWSNDRNLRNTRQSVRADGIERSSR